MDLMSYAFRNNLELYQWAIGKTPEKNMQFLFYFPELKFPFNWFFGTKDGPFYIFMGDFLKITKLRT
jgi:hypothetical protein